MRGLLPGQQLVQMPDGKLQIFTNNLTAKVASSPQQVLLTVLLFIYACSFSVECAAVTFSGKIFLCTVVGLANFLLLTQFYMYQYDM